MFKSAISLCSIFAIALACVIPPADQGDSTPAAAGSPATNNAVVSIAHLPKPDDRAHPAHRAQQSASTHYPVSAMTVSVHELSAATQRTALRDKSTSKEFSNITRSENSNDR
jgi:hypothetical protein